MSVRPGRTRPNPVDLLLSWMSRAGFPPGTVRQAIVNARTIPDYDVERFYDIIAQLIGYLVYSRTGVHVDVNAKIYEDGTVNLLVCGEEKYRLADDWHVADDFDELQDVIEEIVEDIVYEIRNPSSSGGDEPVL